MPVCGSCGHANPARARASACRARPPLAAQEPAPHGARKTVTVVFCDVAGSAPLGERLDPESVREVMTRFFSEMRLAVERHGGNVEKACIGDAVMAVFAVPILHVEDDAFRAVLAAVGMRGALEALNADLEQRFELRLQTHGIGVNTWRGRGRRRGRGSGVGGRRCGQRRGAARAGSGRGRDPARPGDPSRSCATRWSPRLPPPLRMKGKAETMVAYRLVSIEPGAGAVGRMLDPPLVGRMRELETLDRRSVVRWPNAPVYSPRSSVRRG